MCPKTKAILFQRKKEEEEERLSHDACVLKPNKKASWFLSCGLKSDAYYLLIIIVPEPKHSCLQVFNLDYQL